MEHTVHPIERSFLRVHKLGAVMLGILAVFGFWVALVDRVGGISELVTGLAIGVGFSYGSFWCVRLATRASDFTVFLSESAIKVGESGRWVGWREIDRVREQRIGQRLTMFSADSSPIGAIEYQIENVSVVLDAIRRNVIERSEASATPPWGKRGVIAYCIANSLLLASFIALGGWLWNAGSPIIGSLITVAIIGGLYSEARSRIRFLDLEDDGLVFGSALRTWKICQADILAVELFFMPIGNGGRRLDVVIIQQDGTTCSILPPSASAQDVYLAVKRWHQQSVPQIS